MKQFLLTLFAITCPLLSSHAQDCKDPESKPFNGPCVCYDPLTKGQATFTCHPTRYGERFGRDQRGLCKEICDRNSGMEVETAPPENAGASRLEHRVQCRLVEKTVTKVVPVEPSIWNLYKKQREESRSALCILVQRSDRKEAALCSSDDPSNFGRYDLEDKTKKIEAACESLSRRGLVFKDGFSVQSAHWCAHSGQCSEVAVSLDQVKFD